MIRTRTLQPGINFEYMMWIFTRLSGVGLVAMAGLGMLVALVMGARYQMDLPSLMRWAFFPNPNHVVNTSIPDVAQGWSNGFWQIMEMLMVMFGVSHGFNGLRAVVEDVLGQSAFRPLARGIIFVLWLFVLIAAIYVILGS